MKERLLRRVLAMIWIVGTLAAGVLTSSGVAAAPVAIAAGTTAAAERLDALDFDNGAFLLEQSESYSGIWGWSAWGLTDGSDEKGWCTPQGKPLGATYVWELDTTWHLDTLVLSTTNLQEERYPGISAKTIELSIAPMVGPWKSVGRFEVGKEERRSHPLPKNTQAARVKIVVVQNHGHAEFTELAEIDLLGGRAGLPPPRKIDGDYTTTYGPMRFVSDGDQVYGCYDWAPGGSLVWGTITGRVARVTWRELHDVEVREGTATFSMPRKGDQIRGIWYESGALKGEWVGPRVRAADGPKCKPEKKGQLASGLKRQGRVVLYGIRFDTAADVPRADSEGTLAELLEALKAQKDVRVAIEGHTDAKADDAYNLDLSNRRAKSVVAWLTKKGIAPARLEAKGFGRTRPVADNATAEGRALNRRVEASIIK
jgi:outer membrane protein OmpA-like peptidoglycan-associated protein